MRLTGLLEAMITTVSTTGNGQCYVDMPVNRSLTYRGLRRGVRRVAKKGKKGKKGKKK
jgi:hypothetical protein